MSYKIQKQRANEIAQAVKAAGYRVFIAESGTYGFYTDLDGNRLVSFQCGGLRESVSGNYKTDKPGQTGTGWRIDDEFDASKVDHYFNETAPRWAVGNAIWLHTTLEQHLATYQSSSKYTEMA